MDVIGDIIDRICEWLRAFNLSPQFADAMFCRGYGWGIFTAVVFAFAVWLRIQWLMALAKIRAFFQPSALPATRPGPSGYDRALGCRNGFLQIGCIIIAIIVILAVLAVIAIN